MGLHHSFLKLYQIVEVESVNPEKSFEYRVQVNANFKYDECFSKNLLRTPAWEFIDDSVFADSYSAVEYAAKLYDSRINQKLEEYGKERNSIIKRVVSWNELEDLVSRVCSDRGGKWPNPPLK